MREQSFRLLTVFFLLLLCSCSQQVTKEDAVDYFNQHEEVFLYVNDLLLTHLKVDSVYSFESLESEKYTSMDFADQMAYLWIYQKINELDIYGVYFDTLRGTNDSTIVTYTLRYSSLFEKKAYIISILYIPKKDIAKDMERLWHTRLIPLDVDGWYVMEVPWD